MTPSPQFHGHEDNPKSILYEKGATLPSSVQPTPSKQEFTSSAARASREANALEEEL